MADTSTTALNSNLLMSAISTSTNSMPAQTASRVQSQPPKVSIADNSSQSKTASAETKDTSVYAQKGDSNYNSAMDLNGDGTITNQEMSQYYAKLAQSYGSNLNSLQTNTVGNVATTSQAANTYAANEVSYQTAQSGTSMISVSA